MRQFKKRDYLRPRIKHTLPIFSAKLFTPVLELGNPMIQISGVHGCCSLL